MLRADYLNYGTVIDQWANLAVFANTNYLGIVSKGVNDSNSLNAVSVRRADATKATSHGFVRDLPNREYRSHRIQWTFNQAEGRVVLHVV